MQTARAGGPRAQGVYLAGAPPALRVLVAHAMSPRVCPPRHRAPEASGSPEASGPRGIGAPRGFLRRFACPRGNAFGRFWAARRCRAHDRLSRDKRTCLRQPCGTSVPARRRRSQFSSVFSHPPPPCGALLGPAGGRPVLFCICDCGRVRGGPAWGDQAVWVVF